MLRLLAGVVFTVAVSNGQLHHYGPTPAPFAPQDDLYRPTISPVSPTDQPFGPTTVPFDRRYNNPYNTYNNPYYRQNSGAGSDVPILTYSNTQDVQGSYSFSFTTGDGKQVQESGYLKDAYLDNAGEPQGIQVVQGSYAYIAPDGTPIQVSYVADENGYRPSGVHIPSNGKEVSPFPFPALNKDSNNRYLDPSYNRYNQFNRHDPYYRNNVRSYDQRYNPYRQNDYNNPSRFQQNGSKYYQDAYRYNPSQWYNNNHQGFVPQFQGPEAQSKKD